MAFNTHLLADSELVRDDIIEYANSTLDVRESISLEGYRDDVQEKIRNHYFKHRFINTALDNEDIAYYADALITELNISPRVQDGDIKHIDLSQCKAHGLLRPDLWMLGGLGLGAHPDFRATDYGCALGNPDIFTGDDDEPNLTSCAQTTFMDKDFLSVYAALYPSLWDDEAPEILQPYKRENYSGKDYFVALSIYEAESSPLREILINLALSPDDWNKIRDAVSHPHFVPLCEIYRIMFFDPNPLNCGTDIETVSDFATRDTRLSMDEVIQRILSYTFGYLAVLYHSRVAPLSHVGDAKRLLTKLSRKHKGTRQEFFKAGHKLIADSIPDLQKYDTVKLLKEASLSVDDLLKESYEMIDPLYEREYSTDHLAPGLVREA